MRNRNILSEISIMSREFVEKYQLPKSESTRLYLIGERMISGIVHLWEVALGIDKRSKRLIDQNT